MQAKLITGFFGLATLTFVANANALVIDFEDQGVAVGTQNNPPSGVGIATNGFNYTPGPNNLSGANDLHITNGDPSQAPGNGTTTGGTHDDVVLTEATGGLFSLQQFDFSSFATNFEVPFTVAGMTSGGGMVMANFTPDGLVDGNGPAMDFETFLLGPSWTKLTSVTWNHSGAGTGQGLFYLDNIVVNEATQVPEPGTLVLFGFGLTGLVFARRSQAS